jgi:hypothetical protein
VLARDCRRSVDRLNLRRQLSRNQNHRLLSRRRVQPLPFFYTCHKAARSPSPRAIRGSQRFTPINSLTPPIATVPPRLDASDPVSPETVLLRHTRPPPRDTLARSAGQVLAGCRLPTGACGHEPALVADEGVLRLLSRFHCGGAPDDQVAYGLV